MFQAEVKGLLEQYDVLVIVENAAIRADEEYMYLGKNNIVSSGTQRVVKSLTGLWSTIAPSMVFETDYVVSASAAIVAMRMGERDSVPLLTAAASIYLSDLVSHSDLIDPPVLTWGEYEYQIKEIVGDHVKLFLQKFGGSPIDSPYAYIDLERTVYCAGCYRPKIPVRPFPTRRITTVGIVDRLDRTNRKFGIKQDGGGVIDVGYDESRFFYSVYKYLGTGERVMFTIEEKCDAQGKLINALIECSEVDME